MHQGAPPSTPHNQPGHPPPPFMSCVHTSTMSTDLPYMGLEPRKLRIMGLRPMPADPMDPEGGHMGRSGREGIEPTGPC